jgi:GxxExxY protein
MSLKHDLPHSDITEKVIQHAFEVYKTLGPGFDEDTYKKALVLELQTGGMMYETERMVKVYYKNHIVNEYRLDLLVQHNVVVDVICSKEILNVDIKRMKSHLMATKLDVGLLLNFGGSQLEIKRVKP